MITRKILINPQTASRPRVTRKGTFYPKAYTEFKRDFPRLLGARKLLSGALMMRISFTIPIPKSWTKKKKTEMMGKYHTQTPDIDNLEKAVMDAMNGYFYKDDSQIAVMMSYKRWGEVGSIEFQIEEIE